MKPRVRSYVLLGTTIAVLTVAPGGIAKTARVLDSAGGKIASALYEGDLQTALALADQVVSNPSDQTLAFAATTFVAHDNDW